MKFIAEIDIMPLDNLLDPQGKAVKHTIETLGYKTVEDVRIGKHITIRFEAEDKAEAQKIVNEICQKVLYNPIVQKYTYTIIED